jgi:hypothetical protein
MPLHRASIVAYVALGANVALSALSYSFGVNVLFSAGLVEKSPNWLSVPINVIPFLGGV